MITSSTPENWNDLQNEVGCLLEECGFSVEIWSAAVNLSSSTLLAVFVPLCYINARIMCEQVCTLNH